MEFILEQQASMLARTSVHDAQIAEIRANNIILQKQQEENAAQNALFRKTIAKAMAGLADNQENTQRRVEGEANLADKRKAAAEELQILDEKWKAAVEERQAAVEERQAAERAVQEADLKWKAEAEKRHAEMEARQAAAERTSKLVEERLAEFIKATNDRLGRVESDQDRRRN